jgi:hypothetical protein
MARIMTMTSQPAAPIFEDFNLPEQPPEDPIPPEPTFTVAELATARQEAWNDGYLAAAAAGNRDVDRDGQRIFADLLARADDIDNGLEQMAEHNAAAIARWLATAFETALPNLSDGAMVGSTRADGAMVGSTRADGAMDGRTRADGAMDGRTRAVMDLLRSALRSQSKIELHDETGTTVSFHNMHDVCRQIETRQTDEPRDRSIAIAWQQGEARIDASRTWDEIRDAFLPLADAAESSFVLRITQGESTHHVG